ncbi:hypothetical protein Glove_295g23 [Diversispora epigaea]|uniref:Uncharacterized protein n=1 Tax=Diversispora epigaea TaxID=1348612 RepID=A0A397I5B8_9GLOM|nr:hypothetical protein Glove_295g23 [Diversispora epigaea]
MANTQSKIDSLEEQISKLVDENDKLKRDKAEFSAKEAEQSTKESAENTKLRDTKLNEGNAKRDAEISKIAKLNFQQLKQIAIWLLIEIDKFTFENKLYFPEFNNSCNGTLTHKLH